MAMSAGEQKIILESSSFQFEERVNELLEKGCEVLRFEQLQLSGQSYLFALLRMT